MNTKIRVQYMVIEKGHFGDGDIEFGGTFVKTQSFRPNVGDFIRLQMEEDITMCQISQCVIMEYNPQGVDMLIYCEKV